MNYARAAARNAHWAATLGWGAHYHHISELFPTAPRNPFEFAEAVAQWQFTHVPPLVSDGIIGPRTWRILQRELGIPREPAPPNPREAAAEAAGAVHRTLVVRGHSIEFYLYEDISGANAKIEGLKRYFENMPDGHLARIYPIFVMRLKPGGGESGGTWRPGEVAASFNSATHARRTGFLPEEVQGIVSERRLGVIGIPRNRWDRPVERLCFTVLHEVGHSIDYSFPPHGLMPRPFNRSDFEHVRPTCGAGNRDVRLLVEAYARWMCGSREIARDAPAGSNHGAINERIKRALRTSDAFRS